MTNFEKIQKAWRMGWAAVIQLEEKYNRAVIVHVENEVSTVVFIDGYVRGMPCILNSESLNEYSIVDYRYVAELAGNEEPRERQKFLVRSKQQVHGFVYFHKGKNNEIESVLCLDDGKLYSKRFIEPYFN